MRALIENRRGQDLIEYALLACFMAMVVATMIPGVSTGISAVLSNILAVLNPQTTSSIAVN